MDLLFDKNNFSAEFKELLGFVDADIRFARLKSALQSATDEIVDLISETTYQQLLSLSPDAEMLELVKYAIALKAYIIYAPTADLSVTNNGRLMRRDDHTVSAFEWQIEANQEALENLYYRHLDRLLKYMQKNNITINLKKYDSIGLFIPDLKTFEKVYNIGGSHLLYFKLLPGLREFEKIDLLSRIGKNYFDDRTLITTELRDLIELAAVNYAMAWGIRRLNIQLFPKGVLQYSKTGSANKKQGSKLEYLETAMVFDKDTLKYLQKIEDYMSKNKPKNIFVEPIKPIEWDLGFSGDDAFVDL
ncbi:DUF6712 family protein [Riemerella columbina]|uniref:DUF6712 family protein n=1 Tax=Riemerella columbina TaxID=103810 RepID=UPI0003827596|nr:DUF6712 family protein [Riemerella columbina]